MICGNSLFPIFTNKSLSSHQTFLVLKSNVLFKSILRLIPKQDPKSGVEKMHEILHQQFLKLDQGKIYSILTIGVSVVQPLMIKIRMY